MVYLHKARTMEGGMVPSEWPPKDLQVGAPLEFLDDAYRQMVAQFDARRPSDHANTWFEPDQTVGFWIRRMAQETVIHRVDAELAAGLPLAPIPDDLAIDGIDEVLKLFLAYQSEQYPEEFDLDSAGGLAVLVNANGRGWVVRATPKGVTVADGGGDAQAVVSGSPVAVLLRLWRRADDDSVSASGETRAVARLREQLKIATQ
jgi:uncharacterized protein (TIGR03083 family)